jgi:hypothetical protein
LKFRVSPFLLAYLIIGPVLLGIAMTQQSAHHSGVLRLLHLATPDLGGVALPMLEVACLGSLVLLYCTERVHLRHQGAAAAEIDRLNADVAAMLERIALLDDTNRNNHSMIARLKAEISDRKREYESELQRVTEQAYRALKQQVEAQSRHFEAVNLALQSRAAEADGQRSGIADGAMPAIAHLTAAEIAAIYDAAWAHDDSSAAVLSAGEAPEADEPASEPALNCTAAAGREREAESPFGNWSWLNEASDLEATDYTLRTLASPGQTPVALVLTELPGDGREETSNLPVPLPNLKRAVGE